MPPARRRNGPGAIRTPVLEPANPPTDSGAMVNVGVMDS